MGFTKSSNPPEVAIAVTHPWHPGDEYVFHLMKRLDEQAQGRQDEYFALKGDERAEEVRRRRTRALAAMCTREPEGFDDLPRDGRPLPDRIVEYFDDPAQPELERIVAAVWNRYWQEAVPAAYLKSFQDRGAGGGQSTGGSDGASPVV